MIAGFRLEVPENSTLLGYYPASSGNFFQAPKRYLNPKDGTDKLSQNIGKKLPLLAV